MKGNASMKDLCKTALEHPFATVVVVGAVARGVATIIAAARGKPVEPVVQVKTVKNAEPVEDS